MSGGYDPIIAKSTRRPAKRTVCRQCGRTTVIVSSDGRDFVLDTEVVRVVPYGDGVSREPIEARRLHAELCLRYKLERERAQAQAQARAKR